jgi:hypothetical protein
MTYLLDFLRQSGAEISGNLSRESLTELTKLRTGRRAKSEKHQRAGTDGTDRTGQETPPDSGDGLSRVTDGTDETPRPGAPGIDPPDTSWRRSVATWPHERWVEWRLRAGELKPPNATAEQIQVAGWLAYQEMARVPAVAHDIPDPVLFPLEVP